MNIILKCSRITNPAERAVQPIGPCLKKYGSNLEWIYSSATNYQDMESIMEVEMISQRLITIK